MNWSPMSTNAAPGERPRSVNSKKRPYHASASSTSPTSIATWLMPTSFGFMSWRLADVAGADLREKASGGRRVLGDVHAPVALVECAPVLPRLLALDGRLAEVVVVDLLVRRVEPGEGATGVGRRGLLELAHELVVLHQILRLPLG